MKMRNSFILLAVLWVSCVLPALAQQSASYKLNEHVFNAGGRPDNNTEAMAAGFTVSLDSIGDSVVARGLSSSSFRMDAGFTNTYRPPSEVRGLQPLPRDAWHYEQADLRLLRTTGSDPAQHDGR